MTSAVPALPSRAGQEEVRAQPLTAHCARVAQRAEHVLIGLSPGNSYFTSDPNRIRRLIHWGREAAPAMHVFTWAAPWAWWSLAALGYPPEHAWAKARKAHRNLVSRARAALEETGVQRPKEHLITWDELAANPAYLALRRNVGNAFDCDEDFRRACYAVSREYLEAHAHSWRGDLSLQQRLDYAVHYFLDEAPLMLDTATIVHHAHPWCTVDSSLYCYHHANTLHRQLYRGQLPLQPASGQGRVVLTDTPGGTASAGRG